MEPQNREIFQEIILDHDARPRNFGSLDHATHIAEGYNPICGDRYKVFLSVAENRIAAVTFEGYGCAISKASASIMTTIIRGVAPSEAGRLFDSYRRMLSGEEVDNVDELGELAAMVGVRRWPARIKCATLAWQTVVAALDGRERTSTEQ